MARLNEALNYKSKSVYENGTLKNKLNIMDPVELEKQERIITNYKLANLYLKNITGNFDINHYISIHKYLFEEVYEFAGEIRGENIKKQIPFCLPEFIYENLNATLNKMNKLIPKIQNEEELLDFLAEYYSEIDIIHPFREGNGRTEREFFRQLIEKINMIIDFGQYEIDYGKIDNKQAFIKSVIIADATCDYRYLKEFMKMILVKKEKVK